MPGSEPMADTTEATSTRARLRVGLAWPRQTAKAAVHRGSVILTRWVKEAVTWAQSGCQGKGAWSGGHLTHAVVSEEGGQSVEGSQEEGWEAGGAGRGQVGLLCKAGVKADIERG